MKILVTGVNGQLGHDVMNELYRRGLEGVESDITEGYGGVQDGTPVVQMPYAQMDITDQEKVREVITSQLPDAVIHCVAWTAVDLAEDEENQEKVFAINSGGTEKIGSSD